MKPVTDPLLTASVFSGRINIENTELIPFPSIITLPICARVDGSNRELLNRLMRTHSSLLKHQFTPLSKIQRWIGLQDEALFDTLFVYQDASGPVTDDIEPWKVEEETATADVCSLYLVKNRKFPNELKVSDLYRVSSRIFQ